MIDAREFLIRCARIHGNDTFYRQLAAQAAHLPWSDVPNMAEKHGLGPLLYMHLRSAEISPPSLANNVLRGLYLRHRHANAVRLTALTEILTAYQTANIQVVVLKGAALACLIYPQPGLRPMRDLDLLVKPDQARQAQQLLVELGFNISSVTAETLPDKHLQAAGKQVDGLWISVEIHHNLFNTDFPASLTLDEIATPLHPFSLNGLTAYALGYEEMLWHLCQHVAFHANVWEPLRFIWIADIVGFAERFAADIDWARVERDYPLILKTLSVFHSATPLSETLRRTVPLRLGRAIRGLGQEFEGWPRAPLARLRRRGYYRVFQETFFPSEWWLRLHYRLDSAESLIPYRWLRHPWFILSQAIQLVWRRWSVGFGGVERP